MRRSPKAKLDELFIRANKHAEAGNLKQAFRLYLTAAKAGDTSCQVNLGNLYDEGLGVRRNRASAMYWYKRAYRRGDPSAANNIGVMLRKKGKYRRALYWFERAVGLGDDEASLEIAKHYLQIERDFSKAIPHLERVCASNRVTEAGREEAQRLLRRTNRLT